MSTSTVLSGTRFEPRPPPDAARILSAASGTAHAIQGSIWIVFFLLAVVQPFYMLLGDTTMGPYRLYLFVAALPVFAALAQGRAGRIILPDILLMAYAVWMFVASFVVHGSQMKVPFMVAQVVETVVPYFLARVLIRDAANFRFFIRWFLRVILLLLPFALIEMVTNQKLLLQLYGAIPEIVVFRAVNHEPRMGLHRAQGPFEHPILFGVFCAMAFALAWRALPSPKATLAQRMFWPTVCVVGTFSSLSSGALSALILQGILLAWDMILRNVKQRWRIFALSFAGIYLILSLIMDSAPLLYMISNLTFSGGSAWNRVMIWQFGSAEVIRHPIFGIGFKDWIRPDWMVPSVDNYWLLIAMRYGLVGFGLHTGAFLTLLWQVGRVDLSREPEATGRSRSAYLIALTGLSVALGTVFIWSASYSMFMFMLGAGAWICILPPHSAAAAPVTPGDGTPEATSGGHRRAVPRYTRFPPTSPSASGSRAHRPQGAATPTRTPV